jgi:hypothetical protein
MDKPLSRFKDYSSRLWFRSIGAYGYKKFLTKSGSQVVLGGEMQLGIGQVLIPQYITHPIKIKLWVEFEEILIHLVIRIK